MEVARLVTDEGNGCRFELQREKHWIHTGPTWSIAVRERLLVLFYVTKQPNASICTDIGYDTSS